MASGTRVGRGKGRHEVNSIISSKKVGGSPGRGVIGGKHKQGSSSTQKVEEEEQLPKENAFFRGERGKGTGKRSTPNIQSKSCAYTIYTRRPK